MPKLYEISNELAAILGNEEDELGDETYQRLAELELAIESKVENVLQYRQGTVADAEAIDKEADRLKARAGVMKRRAEWLKGYVLRCLMEAGIGKVSTVTFTATVAKSPPKVEIADDAAIPFEYKKEKIEVSIDKTQILMDFKAGKALPPGVTVTHGNNLRIS